MPYQERKKNQEARKQLADLFFLVAEFQISLAFPRRDACRRGRSRYNSFNDSLVEH